MARRTNFILIALFFGVAAAAWWHARPVPVALELARQIALLDRAAAVKAGIDLLPAPTSPEEARERLGEVDRYLAADEGAGWEAFRAWVARRGRPEAVAAGERAWARYRREAEALRSLVARQATAAEGPDALQIKGVEDYMAGLNRLHDAEDGLARWASGLSQADF
ncbi:MAG: hypothetical protein PW734_00665 [Verrucomicrobium sp.]|nr:hypothetical protein [Verrucomicrobium sp.]